MDITCPHCRQTLEADSVNPGEAVVCPACNREFSAPTLVAVGPVPSKGKPQRVSVSKTTTILGVIVCIGLVCFAWGNLFGNQSKVVDEIIANMVLIPGETYRICKYEVTQAQWSAIMGKSKSREPFGSFRKNKGSDKPVVGVSRNECQEFLKKLNQIPRVKKSGLVFRLPTCDEWDQACRAESKGELCRMEDGTEITEKTFGRVAWFKENSDDRLHPVGQLEPNAWGVYDMFGNASEWCEDTTRVSRGGDYNDEIYCCSVDWNGLDEDKHPLAFIGFRLCATDERVVELREKEFAREREEWYVAKIVEDARMVVQNEAKKRQSYLQNKDNAIPDILKSMVRIRGKEFKIGNTEITQEQWESVMGAKSSDKEGLELPVEGVTWNQCQEFLKKLNKNPQVKSAGIVFRLPTEEEIEFAFKNGLAWGDHWLWTQTTENDRPICRRKYDREKKWYSYSGSISLRVCTDCDKNDTTPLATPQPPPLTNPDADLSKLYRSPFKATNGAEGSQYP